VVNYALLISLIWAIIITVVALWRIRSTQTTSRSSRFPLKFQHKILIGLALVSVVWAVGMPLILRPRQLTTIEARVTIRVEPYSTTYLIHGTRAVTTTRTYVHTATAIYTTTYTETTYFTTTAVDRQPHLGMASYLESQQ
jgi:hypothetical protein